MTEGPERLAGSPRSPATDPLDGAASSESRSQQNVETLTNVEIVTAFFAGGEHGDEAYLADDVEFVPFRRLAGAGSRGPKAFTRYIREIARQFAAYEVELERLRDAGDRVVVDVRREARSARCPVPLTDRFAQVFTLREGKIVRIQAYPTFEAALEAAGLRE